MKYSKIEIAFCLHRWNHLHDEIQLILEIVVIMRGVQGTRVEEDHRNQYQLGLYNQILD